MKFTPALYMPNWFSGNTPVAQWNSATSGKSSTPYGGGLEDLTVVTCPSSNAPAGCSNGADSASHPISLESTFASWIKGVRFLGEGSAGNDVVYIADCKNCLFINNYFSDLALDTTDGGGMGAGGDSDNLILNNIAEFGYFMEGTGYGEEGDVLAYNYATNSNTTYVQNNIFQHQPGTSFILTEGNETGVIEDDNTWGTHNLNTWFRNYVSCYDPPYASLKGSPRG